MAHNIGEVLSYIRRTDRVLKKWTDLQIIDLMDEALNEGLLVISTDQNDAINGFAIAKKDKKTLHVVAIQTEDVETFKRFVEYFKRYFKDLTITAFRHGKMKTYETERLCQKILMLV